MINKILEKISIEWIFLAIVALLYFILFLLNFDLTKAAFIEFFFIFQKIVPVIILVFAFMFIAEIFLTPEKITKFLGKDADSKGWLIAIIGGLLSTGPIYMWYPMLSDFREKGMKDSLIVVFLYNRAVKIPLLPMMIYYFSLPFVLILTFYTILFSIISGILVEKIIKSK